MGWECDGAVIRTNLTSFQPTMSPVASTTMRMHPVVALELVLLRRREVKMSQSNKAVEVRRVVFIQEEAETQARNTTIPSEELRPLQMEAMIVSCLSGG